MRAAANRGVRAAAERIVSAGNAAAPVNTIARPRSSAAAITSASRTDPPGCTTAVAPASATRVEAVAEREERVGGRDRCPASDPGAAFITATFTASTRLICPAPTASVRSAPVKITAFDFTCAHTRHANRSADPLLGGRLPLRHDLRDDRRRPSAARRLRRALRSTRSRSWCSTPPRNVRDSPPDRRRRRRAALAAPAKSAVTTRMFCFAARIGLRLVGDRRRDDRLDERRRQRPRRRRRRSAGSARRCRRRPRADRRRARGRRPSSIVAPVATPHGFVCLMTTAAGSVNSSAIRSAASRSSRFVYDSSLPWCTSQRAAGSAPASAATAPSGAGSRRSAGPSAADAPSARRPRASSRRRRTSTCAQRHRDHAVVLRRCARTPSASARTGTSSDGPPARASSSSTLG